MLAEVCLFRRHNQNPSLKHLIGTLERLRAVFVEPAIPQSPGMPLPRPVSHEVEANRQRIGSAGSFQLSITCFCACKQAGGQV